MIFLIIILILIAVIYFYCTRNFNYWKKKGVKHNKPYPLFGTNLKVYLFRESLIQSITTQYKKYAKERIVGFYRSSKPEIIIRDPELVKRVLITDFSYFHQRTSNKNEQELILKNLFSSNGDLWRLLRQRLTPAFTSGKLKAMFPLIVERAQRLQSRIQSIAGEVVDAKELMARFTTDFIGACGFGIDMDSLNDEKSEFRKIGVRIFKVNLSVVIKSLLKEMFPHLFKNVRTTKRIEDDIVPLVQSILKQRNYQPSGRNDFIDLLLECQKKGAIVGESIESYKPDGTPKEAILEMTDDILAAQVFVFFAAGFETSSYTTSLTLHLLAYHPEIQKKVQDKIDQVLLKHGNKLCYNAIKEMDYLEWALKESMRILPPAGILIRTCTRKYTLPDMDITIDSGVNILIPVEALQNDPQYWDQPEEFRPERFNPEHFKEQHKYVYMPFGNGPRACIGERLGLMQSLAGLAAVLSKYSVEPSPKSVRYPVIDKKPTLIQIIPAGLPLYFRERKKEK